jgi:hypothetical protein
MLVLVSSVPFAVNARNREVAACGSLLHLFACTVGMTRHGHPDHRVYMSMQPITRGSFQDQPDRLVGMKDNVRVQRSEAGAIIEVDAAAGTLAKTYETLPLAGTAAFELDLIPYKYERLLQREGENGCSSLCDHIDLDALRAAGFRLVTGRP